jgi:tetratricopeptide (TPR) repeat protein
LKSVVSGIIEVLENDVIGPEALVVAVFQTVDFIDVSPLTTAVAYLRVLQLPKAFDCLLSAKDNPMNITNKEEVLLMLSSCYNMVGKFQEAIECCREVQTLHTLAPDVVPLLPALELIMTSYVGQGLYNEARKMYKEIMDYQERPDMKENFVEKELDFLKRSAFLFMNIEQYNTAEDILRTIIEKIRNQRRYYFVYFSCLNNLAFILLNRKKPTEAKTVLNDALNIASELYGENAVHPSFAWCLTNLSEAHYHLQNIEEANRFLQLALIIYSHLHEHELIDPGIIVALIMEARIHQFYERWDQMWNSLNKAKQIAEIVYRDNPHPNVAWILFYLGYCEQQLGRFSEAINRYQEYLKIHENERMECQQSGHDCNTAYVLVQIANMGACCSYDASYLLSCLEKALEIEENIHGKECNHRHSAMCIGLLGYRLITADRESKGLEYLCRAMQMFEEINLDSDKIYGQAQLLQLLFGNILGENCINKSEKHLRTVEAILKKRLKDNCHVALLEINSFLLKIFLQANKIQDGLELAEQQRHLIHTMLSKSSVPSAQQLYQVFHLAAFFEDSGRRNTAKEMYFDLISRLEEQVDPTDSGKDALTRLLWMTQQQLGEIYRTNGMFCDAEAMFQRIASSVQKTTSKRAFVKDTRHDTQNSLAAVFTETGRYLQAYELLDDLINIYEKDSKSIDVSTASCAFSIRGELNRRCFRFNFALKDMEKALKLAEQFYGASAIHNVTLRRQNMKIDYAKMMNTIGLIYEQNNNLKRALEYYFCSLSTVEGIPVTMGTATFHQNVADTLKKLGKLDAALVHYKKSLEIRETLHSEDPEREDIATVLYHIAIVQYTDGRPKDASATLDRLIPLRKELLCKGGSLQGGSLQNYGAAIVMKGNCHIVQPGEAKQAKDAYEEAEKVFEILTEGQPNLDYAGGLSNIGEHNIYMYRKRL